MNDFFFCNLFARHKLIIGSFYQILDFYSCFHYNFCMAKKTSLDMTQGAIFPKLLQFCIPVILSGLLQLLFNAADIIVVGRFAGDNCLAAVGSTTSLTHLLTNLFIGLSTGTNVVASNYFGARKSKEINETVHTAILLSIYSSIVLTIIGVLFAKPILMLMQSPEDVVDLAAVYLKIIFAGIAPTLIYNFGSALLRAKGDTKRPLFYLFASGILNVVLNLIFVIVLHMAVAGVALATVISQALAAALVIFALVKDDDDFHLTWRRLKIQRHIMYNILRMGIPAGLQGMIFSFSNVIIQSSINGFGAVLVAGSSAAANIEGFVWTSMNGVSQGALTFCSQNLGAAKYDRIKKSVWVALFFVTGVGLIMGGLAAFFAPQLLGIYTNSAEVIKAGQTRVWIICYSYLLCGIMDVMASCIRGVGYSMLPTAITLAGACGIRILWLSTVFQMERFHLPVTIFMSYPISWSITFVALTICYMTLLHHSKGKFGTLD